MIYGRFDTIPKSENFKNYVPNLEVISLENKHWI